MIQTVLKRDGRIVSFDSSKIVTAVRKAMLQTEQGENLRFSPFGGAAHPVEGP